MVADFQGFPYPHVVAKLSLIFSLHVMDGSKVVCVEAVLAVLVVLCDAGVLPLFLCYCVSMFFPSCFV